MHAERLLRLLFETFVLYKTFYKLNSVLIQYLRKVPKNIIGLVQLWDTATKSTFSLSVASLLVYSVPTLHRHGEAIQHYYFNACWTPTQYFCLCYFKKAATYGNSQVRMPVLLHSGGMLSHKITCCALVMMNLNNCQKYT